MPAMRLRWGAYAGVSTALAGGVIVKALAQRPNFYSAAVYLAQSNANLMILTNLVFVAACAFILFLQKLLYGTLRPIEIEQLYEKAWFAVTETCLAMTIFRGEIGAWFLVMFFALLTGKVWGWIGEGRVEILEQQPPARPRLFHTRMAASLLLSVLYDTWMLEYVVKQVLDMARPDMMVMFGFEFAVLSVVSLSTLARYGISLVEILIVRGQKFRRAEEIRRERKEAREAEQRAVREGVETTTTSETHPSPTPTTALATVDEPIDDSELEVEGWEEKGRWIFYLDLTTDFFKLIIYLSFFFILLVFYGLPIHIMRDVFLTCRSFFKRIGDFIRYRTATKDMNERYPDATVEEIGTGEDLCIICREEMRVIPRADTGADGTVQRPNAVAERMRPKKLPCGHVLHFSCLRSWLERQQICPTCRRPVVSTARVQPGARAAGAGLAGGFAQGFVDGVNAGRGVLGPNQAPQQQGQGQIHAQEPDQPVEAQNPNRPRVWQLGPLRIAIGAGRGMVLEDLAQRVLHEGEPAQNQAANGQQQYGFGFGFGRQNRRTHRTTDIQGQLDSVERRIQREIDSLRLSANELNVVRILQGELTRLRGLRAQQQVTTGGAPSTITAPQTQTQVQVQGQPQTQPATTTATGFVADTRANVLEAGNEALPEGLVLPEGWSMMPLQRMQPGTQIPPMGTAFAPPPGSFGGFGGGMAGHVAGGQFNVPAGQIPDIWNQFGLPGIGQQMPQQGQQFQQNQQVNGVGQHHHHHHHHLHQPRQPAAASVTATAPGEPQEEAMRRLRSTIRMQEQQIAQITAEQRQRLESQGRLVQQQPQQQQAQTQTQTQQPQQAAPSGEAGPDAATNGTAMAPVQQTQPPSYVAQPLSFVTAMPTHEEQIQRERERRDQAIQALLQRRRTEHERREREESEVESPPRPVEVAASEVRSGSQDTAGSIAAITPTILPVPVWGSVGGNAQAEAARSTAQDSNEATPNGTHGDEAEAEVSRKPKVATVEDMVEGPD